MLCCVLVLASCAEHKNSLSAPPVPADLAKFDAEIAAAIQSEVDGLARESTRPESWLRLGMLYHTHDQLEFAAACYRQSMILDPNQVRARYYLALSEHQSGRVEEAIVEMRRAADLDPIYPPTKWKLGLWLLEQGDVEAALDILCVARAHASDDPSGHHLLARAHLQVDQVAEAVEVLTVWLGRHDDDRYARFLLGKAYRRLGRNEEASRELTLGQGAQPSWPDPWSERLEQKRTGFSARLEAASRLLESYPEHQLEEESARAGFGRVFRPRIPSRGVSGV